MDTKEILIDNESIIEYVARYEVVPNLREMVQLAQDDFPEVQPLGLRPVNIERVIDELASKSVTTIQQLEKSLQEHREEIITAFNNYDREAIAARHVFTPIYLLLDMI
jgi:hypothetical protein